MGCAVDQVTFTNSTEGCCILKASIHQSLVPFSSETLLLRYIDNLQHVLELWNIKKYGRAVRIYRFDFVPGTIVDYSVGHIEPSTLEIFVQVEHFLNPGTTYRCLLNGYYVGCDVSY